jgi:hypothetical protein
VSEPTLSSALPPEWDAQQDCLAARVSVGAGHHCVITRGDHLWCWGLNEARQLGAEGGAKDCGAPAMACSRVPVPVAALDHVSGVAVVPAATCALSEGNVYCWGSDHGGMLGSRVQTSCDNPLYGVDAQAARSFPCTATPSLVPGLLEPVDIDGWGRICVAERGGFVKCWGYTASQQPTAVLQLDDAIGVEDGCALRHGGGVACWEVNLTAVPVDWDGSAVKLTKGYNQGCVIDAAGALSCWGVDWAWDGGVRPCLGCTPLLVEEAGVVKDVSGGLEITWFVTAEGRVRSLTTAGVSEPLSLPGPVVHLSAGYWGACAVLEDGRLYCWSNDASPRNDHDPAYAPGPATPAEIPLCVE